MASTNKGWYSRQYLPHLDLPELTQSITFRLYDSLPQSRLNDLRQDLAKLPLDERELVYRKKIECWLDAGYGSCFLSVPEVAQVVEEALLFFHKQRYLLHAWVIMPNHVHVLLTVSEQNSLPRIMHALKSFSATKANAILNRHGIFWMREYFDRYVRDAKHFSTVVDYIEQNPVSAGLCISPQKWKFSSAGKSGGFQSHAFHV